MQKLHTIPIKIKRFIENHACFDEDARIFENDFDEFWIL